MSYYTICNIILLLFITLVTIVINSSKNKDKIENYYYQGLTAAFIDLATYSNVDSYLYN